MLIRHKKPFLRGILLLASFVAAAIVMMLPIFHSSTSSKLTCLQYADTVFNSLSKGSSYFIPQVLDKISGMRGHAVSLEVRIANPETAGLAVTELQAAGAKADFNSGTVRFSGDLGAILQSATQDAASLYANNGDAVSSRYAGAPPLEAAQAWWRLLNPCIRELQKQHDMPAAKAVEAVVRRAIEPGNNFYGITTANVANHIALVCCMLAFYVLYAIWYGFALYLIFEGMGLIGKKDHA